MRNPWKLTSLVLALALAAVVGVQLAPRATAATSQPHMKAALSATQTAIRQLDKASHDKGGHRLKAKALLVDAEKEIKLGIAAGNQ